MLRRWTLARMRAELGALEASAERAGAALACIHSSSQEFEAAELAARRSARRRMPPYLGTMQLMLLATGIAACATLAALAIAAL